MTDGSEGPPLELRGLFEQYNRRCAHATMKRPRLPGVHRSGLCSLAQLRELAAWTCEYWRQRKGGDAHGRAGEIDISPGHRALRQQRQHRDRGAASGQ